MFEGIIQNFLNALQWGSFYSLIALGYCLVYGVLLLINFAHGDIFMVGAYVAFFVATFFLGSGFLPGWAVLALTVPLTMALTSAVGVTLERVAYRPLRKKGAHRLYVVVTALMCGIILENANLALLGASRRGFPELVDTVVYSIGGVNFTNLKVAVIVIAILSFLLLEFVISKTKIGMAMRAISYDRFAIPLMGIPPDTVIVFTFVLGSSFAALAGLLFAMSYPILDPYMGAMIGWKAFIAAVCRRHWRDPRRFCRRIPARFRGNHGCGFLPLNLPRSDSVHHFIVHTVDEADRSVRGGQTPENMTIPQRE